MEPPNYNEMTPRDVGRLLALSIGTICRADKFSKMEQELLRAVPDLEITYLDELIILVMFAMDYAIVTLLGESTKGKEVRTGFLEVWESQSKKNSKYLAFYRLFLKRCPVYGKAVVGLAPGTISPIALAFGGNLRSESSEAQLLALTFADNYFFGTVESVGNILREANLMA